MYLNCKATAVLPSCKACCSNVWSLAPDWQKLPPDLRAALAGDDDSEEDEEEAQATAVAKAMEGLDLAYPKVEGQALKDLQSARKALEAEG